jgi:hypothetical protein
MLYIEMCYFRIMGITHLRAPNRAVLILGFRHIDEHFDSLTDSSVSLQMETMSWEIWWVKNLKEVVSLASKY